LGVNLIVRGHGVEGDAARCFPNDGFKDLNVGAMVIVTDEAGVVIATGEIAPHPNGAFFNTNLFDPQGNLVGAHCLFRVDVKGVPDSNFYTINIGPRKGPTWSLSELEALNWHTELIID
jgi:hypothetical protein